MVVTVPARREAMSILAKERKANSRCINARGTMQRLPRVKFMLKKRVSGVSDG
jgi:hypothetical protein